MSKYKSRRAVVSREAKKKQHVYAYSGLCNHCSVAIYTDDRSKFLKCCSLATITAIA